MRGHLSRRKPNSMMIMLQELTNFHDRRYASFSRLLRMTFDEACGFFENGTVDLLHIDGYHTYEAVSHDFEVWRSKLSNRAVVLFHDTNVRIGDFGVWRFFAELRKGLPSFEFLHGNGLGVVAVGPDAPAAVRNLCELDDKNILALRERFAYFGARWISTIEKGELGLELKSRDKDLKDVREVYARAVAEHEATVTWAKSLDKDLKDLRETYAHAVVEHEATVTWAKSLDKDVKDVREVYARAVAEHEATVTWAESLEKDLTDAREVYARTVAEHEAAAARAKSLDREFKEVREVHARTVIAHEATVARAKSLDDELTDLRARHAAASADHLAAIAWARSLERDLSNVYAAHAQLIEETEKSTLAKKHYDSQVAEMRASLARASAQQETDFTTR